MNWAAGLLGKPIHPKSAIVPTPHLGSVSVTNQALGAATDLLVQSGGTAILSETPEIYGVEHLLTRRAVSREVGDWLIGRIHRWEEFCAQQRREEQRSAGGE